MVSVKPQGGRRRRKWGWQPIHVLVVLAGLVVIYIFGTVIFLIGSSNTDTASTTSSLSTPAEDRQLRAERINRPDRPHSISIVLDESTWAKKRNENVKCSYKSLADLTSDESHPKRGSRHLITPPSGGKLSLVCCETSVGNLNIVAHHNWAPLGAQRFMDMVTSGYFNTGVPFMRCVKGFLCQFGLNADASKSNDFRRSIPDDPNWLPEGPAHRTSRLGAKRFAQGYLAYAGSGPESRSKQLIMSLEANGPLGGGSPWEVPWGELVSPESFETLKKIYTGYGEKGPPQGKLGKQGMTTELRQEFPKLDYIQSCTLVDEAIFHEVSKDSLSRDD